MKEIRLDFQKGYRTMLETIAAIGKPLIVCTIYDAVPLIDGAERAALSLFNDVILRETFRLRIPVIDLRLVCNEPTDYAHSSPIEPSVAGGGKIARMILGVLMEADNAARFTSVFA